MSPQSQIYEIFGCIYIGFVMGIWYSLLGIVRFPLRKSTVCTVIADILFWLGAFCLSCVGMYFISYGYVALFHVICMGMGFIIYLKSTHRLLQKVVAFVFFK